MVRENSTLAACRGLREQHLRGAGAPPLRVHRRRVWSLIPFGQELDMLMLHMHTIEPEVHGFLVTESSRVHASHTRKPLLLTEALARGRVPPELAAKLSVEAVEFDRAAQDKYCGRASHVQCMEQLQRFRLLRMLFARAEPHDVALACDTDEIPRPSAVQLLRDCAMFEGGGAPSQPPPTMYVLVLARYTYGVHCVLGNDGVLSARAFSVRHLRDAYDEANPKAALPSLRQELSMQRMRTRGVPHLHGGGWHLSSFGEPWELRRKLQTWLHADMFRNPVKEARGKRDGGAEGERGTHCCARGTHCCARGARHSPGARS
eukprot:5014759-Prymnesium_polylepis.1